MTMTEKAQRSAAHWHDPTFEIETSKGVAEVRFVDVMEVILEDGSIPDSLAAFISERLASGLNANVNGRPNEIDLSDVPFMVTPEQVQDDLPNWGKFITAVAVKALVWPRLVEKVTDPENEITLRQFKMIDRVTIFGLVMGEGEEKKT